jgi:hypothetical protein
VKRLMALERQSEELRAEIRRLRSDLLAAGGGSEGSERSGAGTERGPEVGSAPAGSAGPAEGLGWRRRWGPDLEFWLGGRGLLLLGVLALVFAVGFFVKEAVERGWIGPGARVLLGAGVGAAAIGVGERVRASGLRTYGLWLSAGGFGAVYVSVWAAAALYSLLATPAAFSLLVAVIAAAAGLGLTRRSESFTALAALGGYLAPVLLPVEGASAVLSLGYLALLSGAGLWAADRAGWANLAAVALAGGAVMTLFAGRGAPHLHGLYLVLLAAAAMAMARRNGWPAVALLVVLAGWLVYVVGSGRWGISGLWFSAYAGGLWLADLLPVAGGTTLSSGRRALARPAEPVERVGGAGGRETALGVEGLIAPWVSVLPPAFFYLAALAGVADSALAGSRGPIGLGLGLAIGAVHAGLAASAGSREEGAGQSWHRWVALAFWLVAPRVMWSAGLPLAGAWLAEGAILTIAGVALSIREPRAAGLAALVLALTTYLGNPGARPAADPAFVSAWALTGLATVLGLAAWVASLARVKRPADWETAVRPFVLLGAAVVFLAWGTGEIGQLFDRPGGGSGLARDLSTSAFWMAYAAALLVAGFRLQRAAVRWAGLGMALTAAAKVFVYDLSNLARLYRIVSLVLLALVLLALSFRYQRLRRDGGSPS